ncbi:DUF6541 family protein [Brachybacterium sp. AOP3-A1-3]|uniref:DUF6541 family protein n=1 Tax=Brachybacterium sp. AOP3-A1-3 TaxID=3457699 RepID=UPI004034A100
MEALGVLAALLATLAVLVVPGLPAVLALRLRPLTGVAVLAPVSLLLIAISAELGHQLGIRWTGLSPLVLGLLLGAGLLLVGRRRAAAPAPSHPSPSHPAPSSAKAAADPAVAPSPELAGVRALLAGRRGAALAILGGLVIGCGVLLARALTMMGSVGALSQTYDNVFHLNAIRHILRAGDGSAWVVGGMTALPGEAVYYPALWHQAVSLAVQLSGQEIILVSNLMMLVVGVLVWPLALVALVRTTTSSGPLGWMAAGALAGVSGAFPLSLMSWGIVLPYLLSLVLMPLVVMMVVHLTGLAPESAQRLSTLQLVVLLPAVCLAAALAHPQGVFVGIVLGLPILAWATLVRARDLIAGVPGSVRRLLPLVVMTVGGGAIAWQVWQRARPPQSSAVWEPNASWREAIGQVGSLSPNGAPTWLPLGVVMLVGLLVVLLRTRSRWLVASWLAAAALSVAARATPVGDLRYLLTGGWYSDTFRIAAIVPVVAIPVLAVGIDALGRWVDEHLPARRGAIAPGTSRSVAALAGPTAAALPVAGVLGVLGVLALAQLSPATRANLDYLAVDWHSDALLTADEHTLLEQLPDVVPEDAVIATNAWNGSSLAYAISDRPVLNTYMGFSAEPEVHLLNGRLDEAQTNPEVCDAAEQLHVDYALDFGAQELHGRSATYTGLNEISESGAAEVVLQVGDAKLLRMLPCRGVDGSMTS